MPPGGGSAGAGTTPTPTEESTPFPMTPPLEPPQDMPGLRQDVLGWFIQRQGERWGPQDEAAFQGWLAADARHQNAFSEWEAHWATLDTVPAEAVARLRLQLARDKAREAAPPPTSVLGGSAAFPRRKFLKPAFATAAVVAVAGSAALVAASGSVSAAAAFFRAASSAAAELSTASTRSQTEAKCSAKPPVEVKQSSARPPPLRAAQIRAAT